MLLKLNLLLLISFIYAAPVNKWEQKYVKDNITVFSREVPGSDFIASRAEMVVNSQLANLLDLINNFDEYPDFIHNCKSAKLINKSGNSYVAYLTFDAPWPLTDRDVYIQLIVNKEAEKVVISLKDLEKYSTKKGYVRIEDLNGKWLLDPLGSSQVKVVFEIHIDPGGSVPSWVVNNSADDQVFYTLKRARAKIN